MPSRRLSTSFKLALANAAVLAASFGLLLLLVTFLAERFMVRHVAESVEAELHILEAEFRVDGPRGVAALIEQRMQIRSPNHDRRYRLERADGTALAANLDRWPIAAPAAGIEFRRPSLRPQADTDLVMQWATLPDGSRLLVGYDEIEVEQVRGDLHRAALWSLGATLLVSLVVGHWLTRVVLRPVESIRGAALRIMDGDLSHRIALRGTDDEFDRLGQTLNDMLDRIGQLITSVKGATDNIAHDLRSPLTRLRSRMEAYLAERPAGAADSELVEHCIADLDQVLATFRALLRIASVESGLLRAEFAPCDLSVLLRDAVEFVEPMAEDKHQAVVRRCGDSLPLSGHRDLLFQALVNLLDNAIKYGPEGGRVDATARREDEVIVIEIRDQGPGIPPAEQARIFERLYRLDHSRSTPGLGLGLALVKAIADVHEGVIDCESTGAGSVFRLCIPVSPRFTIS